MYKPISFNKFRPISLCNLALKIISKIIPNLIKPYLSKLISKEKLGFLVDRHILDVIEVNQECLHTINAKYVDALLLKIDLVKAYDHVDWVYLWLLLLQIGLPVFETNLIMFCVTFDEFLILINGSPTNFFKSIGGIIHGSFISPLLFILIIECLSHMINRAKDEGKLKRIKI